MNIVSYLKSLWVSLTPMKDPKTVIAEELHFTRLELIAALTKQEDYAAQVTVYRSRIIRLQEMLNSEV